MRRNVIQIAVLSGLVILIAALILSMLHLRKGDYSLLADRMAQGSRSALRVMKPCPICGTLLEPGQRVHTVVFSGEPPGRAATRGGERTRDALVHMFGCPYCHPSNERYPRICPVCDATLEADGYLIARMFTRETRKHVHVLGCTSCRSAAVERRQRHSG